MHEPKEAMWKIEAARGVSTSWGERVEIYCKACTYNPTHNKTPSKDPWKDTLQTLAVNIWSEGESPWSKRGNVSRESHIHSGPPNSCYCHYIYCTLRHVLNIFQKPFTFQAWKLPVVNACNSWSVNQTPTEKMQIWSTCLATHTVEESR